MFNKTIIFDDSIAHINGMFTLMYDTIINDRGMNQLAKETECLLNLINELKEYKTETIDSVISAITKAREKGDKLYRPFLKGLIAILNNVKKNNIK